MSHNIDIKTHNRPRMSHNIDIKTQIIYPFRPIIEFKHMTNFSFEFKFK